MHIFIINLEIRIDHFSFIHLFNIIPLDRNLDMREVQAVRQGSPLQQSLLQVLKASVRDAALIEVNDLQVVAEGILGLYEGCDGAGAPVANVGVSFQGQADQTLSSSCSAAICIALSAPPAGCLIGIVASCLICHD